MQRRYQTLPLDFQQLQRFRRIQEFTLPSETITQLEFSKTGTYVAFASSSFVYLLESQKISNLQSWTLFQFQQDVNAFVFLRPTRAHKVQELLVCNGVQLIIISLDSKRARLAFDIPLNFVNKLLRTDENLYYVALSSKEEAIYFHSTHPSRSSTLLRCKQLLGAANRPRCKVIVICERTLLESEVLGLSLKFVRYDQNPFKTVKHLKLPFTGTAVEFSESASYLAILNFKEVTIISLSAGKPLKRIILFEIPTCLDFLPNDGHIVIGDKAGDLFIVELKRERSQLVILMNQKRDEIMKVRMNPRKLQLLSVGKGGEVAHWGI